MKENAAAIVRLYGRSIEDNRILAETLIGLRNIAWAAANKDKTSKHAKFMYTALQMAIESPDSIDIVRLALLMSPQDI